MTTRKEKILQKLNPNLLKITPKLSSGTCSFVDLDSEESPEDGVKKLMMRFYRNQDLCEKNERNSAQTETEFITYDAKYNERNEICEIIPERLTLPFKRNDDVPERPGRRLKKLQMELQEKISAKWEKEYKKRVKQSKVYHKSKNKYGKKYSDSDSDSDSDDDKSDNNYDSANSSEKKTEGKNIDKGFAKKSENENYDDGDDADIELEDDEDISEFAVGSVINDEKIEQNDCHCIQSDNFEKEDDYESCSLVPAYQPGGGMLYGGSELTQCDEELPQDLLSPSLKLSLNELSGSATEMSSENTSDPSLKKIETGSTEEANNSVSLKTKLFSQNANDLFDLNDAFEFCSGKFPEENSELQLGVQDLIETNKNISNKDKNITNYDDYDDNLFDGDSMFEVLESKKKVSRTKKNIIAFEDSDEEDREIVNDSESEKPEENCIAAPDLLSDDGDEIAVTDKTTNTKKTRKSLYFSDEEDIVKDCKDEETYNPDNMGSSEKEDEDDNFENERSKMKDEFDRISVQYDSEENEIINPKEFFEKEAELSGSEWSEDEDEKGLDKFDVEDGDADILDGDEVRSQLEKIHIRQVLDDDAREVRLIQEILFEDGDLHSDEKRRDRKFKWKNLGVFDEQEDEKESKEGGGSSSEDDEIEEALRKLRHEKELFFMTKKKDGDLSSDDDIVKDFHTVKVTRIKTSIKLTAKNENMIDNSKIGCTELFKTACLSACNARGSFLTRNEQFLSRLAKSTSTVTDNVLGPKNSKNFVFMTKSPEKVNANRSAVCKRQIKDTESCGRREKRIKVLSPVTHTGPSILDLLS